MVAKQLVPTVIEFPNPNPKLCIKVAKDVLRLLKLKDSINPTRNYYFQPSEEFEKYEKTIDKYDLCQVNAKPVISKVRRNCKVCALGAMIVSWTGLFNNITLGELRYSQTGSWITELKKAFSEEQLAIIENIFEGNTNKLIYIDYYNNKDYLKYTKKYKSPRAILIAVMKNIIKNNGQFIF